MGKKSIDLSKEVSKKKLSGVGDVIKSITSTLGIESCEDCESRRLKLNKAFSFLRNVIRDLDSEEVLYILEIERSKFIDDPTKFLRIYNSIYGTNVKPCNCPSVYKDLTSRLVMQIEFQNIK